MSRKVYKGEIKARIIELRFAFSGKVAFVSKKRGDLVKKWEAVAGLDKKTLQAELDRQLADFEKTRAEFEIYNLQKGEPTNDVAKYFKLQKQAELNISVKDVELAKSKLDQADLISPLEGMIVEDSGLISGVNVTPASGSVIILDFSSYYFEFEIDQSQLLDFKNPVQVKISFAGLEKEILGKTREVVPSLSAKPGKFLVMADPADKIGLVLGMLGEAKIASII